ncbi:unnamed protein product [Rhizophagus irregularis]|nr:unnamed protein product [Rhizophagus irregularis]
MSNEFLTKKEIKISNQSLAFDYLSFCRSIDIKIIDDIISVGSPLEYNRFLLQEEIYSLLIKKCPEIKYLKIRGIYEIVYLSEAKFRLESLCELTCDTLIDPKYFYRLAHICQRIQRIIIINKNLVEVNNGTTKLIEFQKNLKYFKWVDDFNEDSYWELFEDPYAEIFNVLKKHANTLNHFDINLRYEYEDYSDYYDIYNECNYAFLQYAFLELHNLKILEINSPIFLNNDDFNKKLEMVAYRNLEILEISFIHHIYQITCMVKNSLCLRELRVIAFHWNYGNIYNDSLNFIRTIYENCLLIEYLTIPMFPLLENHFIEFKKLLKKCQNLRYLYFKEIYYEKWDDLEYGDYLSNTLIKEASTNLKKIGIPHGIKFSLETLKAFFEKWKGRPAISIYLVDFHSYQTNSYMKLINKAKIEGVIKHINV